MAPLLSDAANYLSLALDSRRAIKELVKFATTGERSGHLELTINDAVSSLRALETNSLYAHLNSPSSYEHHEQMEMLEDVKIALGGPVVTARLQRVLVDQDPAQKIEDTRFAIKFFSTLESRALHQYNRPVRDELTI